MQVNESILTKIKNALAKAAPGSGATEAEAQSALLMAQKLMAKYNIEMSAVVDTEVSKKVDVDHGVIETYEKVVWWKGNLAGIIAENFRCHSYYRRWGRYTRWGQGSGTITELRFLGLKEDVEIAKEVFQAASDMIQYHSKKYLKQRKKEAEEKANVNFKEMSTRELEEYALEVADMVPYEIEELQYRYREEKIYKMRLIMAIKDALGISINPSRLMYDYITGFLAGLSAKFKEQVKSESLELVLVTHPAVQDELEKLNLKKGSQSSAKGSGDIRAQMAGYEQGKKFSGPMKKLKDQN